MLWLLLTSNLTVLCSALYSPTIRNFCSQKRPNLTSELLHKRSAGRLLPELHVLAITSFGKPFLTLSNTHLVSLCMLPGKKHLIRDLCHTAPLLVYLAPTSVWGLVLYFSMLAWVALMSIFPALTNRIPILSKWQCAQLPWQPQRAVRELATEIEAENHRWGTAEELIFLTKALSLLLST